MKSTVRMGCGGGVDPTVMVTATKGHGDVLAFMMCSVCSVRRC